MFPCVGGCLTALSVSSSVRASGAARRLASKRPSWHLRIRRIDYLPVPGTRRNYRNNDRQTRNHGQLGGSSVYRTSKAQTLPATHGRGLGHLDLSSPHNDSSGNTPIANDPQPRENVRYKASDPAQKHRLPPFSISGPGQPAWGFRAETPPANQRDSPRVLAEEEDRDPYLLPDTLEETAVRQPYETHIENEHPSDSNTSIPADRGLWASSPARTRRHPVDRKWRAKFYGDKWVNWLPLVRQLRYVFARSPPSQHGVSMTVSDRVLVAYTGSSQPNSWVENIGTNVRVRVVPREASSKSPFTDVHSSARGSCIVFEGSAALVRDVAQRFQQLSDDLETAISSFSGTSDTGHSLHSINSIASFHAYVVRITAQTTWRTIEKSLVADLHQFTADRLCRAFTDPVISRFASTVALNRALQYLHTNSELHDAADLVYAHGRQLGLVNDITTLNSRLEFAIQRNLVDQASAIVQDMREFDVPANSRTWGLFYRASRNNAEKSEIVHSMHRAGVSIGWEARAWLALPLAEQQLRTVKQTEDWNKVVDDMDVVFGKNQWMSPQTFTLLLDLARRENLDKAFEGILKTSREQPDPEQFSFDGAYFTYLKTRLDLKHAVKILLALIEQKAARSVIAVAIPKIIMIAWQLKALNVCRLLWRFCAVEGIVTHSMWFVMQRALLSRGFLQSNDSHDSNEFTWEHEPDRLVDHQSDDGNGPKETSPKRPLSSEQRDRRRWQWIAARNAVGIDTAYLEQIKHQFPNLVDHFPPSTSSIDLISTRLPSDSRRLRKDQITLAWRILYRDMHAWQRYRAVPLGLLSRLLEKAVDVDLEWIQEGKSPTMSWAETQQDAIDLRVLEKNNDMLRKDDEMRKQVLEEAQYVGTELKKNRQSQYTTTADQERDAEIKVDVGSTDEEDPSYAEDRRYEEDHVLKVRRVKSAPEAPPKPSSSIAFEEPRKVRIR